MLIFYFFFTLNTLHIIVLNVKKCIVFAQYNKYQIIKYLPNFAQNIEDIAFCKDFTLNFLNLAQCQISSIAQVKSDSRMRKF